jgi:L-serine dehydratase
MKRAALLLAGRSIPFGGYLCGTPAEDGPYRGQGNNIVEIIAARNERQSGAVRRPSSGQRPDPTRPVSTRPDPSRTDPNPANTPYQDEAPTGAPVLLKIVGFSIGGGNVEVRYINDRLPRPITKIEEVDAVVAQVGHKVAVDAQSVGNITQPCKDGSGAVQIAVGDEEHCLNFNTFEELLEYCRQVPEKSLLSVVLETERMMTGQPTVHTRRRMEKLWRVMEQAVYTGLAVHTRSPSGLCGGDGAKIAAFLKRGEPRAERRAEYRGEPQQKSGSLFANLHGKAMAYATAVSEQNARSGVVVACPTAGACGIIPGMLVAHRELGNTSVDAIVDALLVAGFVGMVFFDDVTTAGADYGCQAEVGAASAMGAAALAHLEGGDIETVVHAFVLAIKNCMGLICDPVAGLVEVPCVKRNGLFSSLAVSAAAMALAGVRSFVSPDEVVLAVREVGSRLHRDYRETAGGGLARTRDGKRVLEQLRAERARWFERR